MELSEYVPINLICLAVLGALGLRRLVRMDGHHELRVVILTGLLWVPVLCLFHLAFLTPGTYGCFTPPPDVSDSFTISE